jgi:hypothetical protein
MTCSLAPGKLTGCIKNVGAKNQPLFPASAAVNLPVLKICDDSAAAFTEKVHGSPAYRRIYFIDASRYLFISGAVMSETSLTKCPFLISSSASMIKVMAMSSILNLVKSTMAQNTLITCSAEFLFSKINVLLHYCELHSFCKCLAVYILSTCGKHNLI